MKTMTIKRINDEVCRGVAGKMTSVKGIVFHNTADHLTALQHRDRLKRMTPKELEQGFAHFFTDESTVVRTEHTYNGAWHVANPCGNYHFIGIEVSRSTSDKETFLKSEKNAMQLAVELLTYYKLPINSDTVKFHSEFVPTSCPHRTTELHGGTKAKAKQWLIENLQRIKDGKTVIDTPKPAPAPPVKPVPKPKPQGVKWYDEKGSYTLKYATNLRTQPNTRGGFIATLPAGSVIKYDKFAHVDGHVWIRQPRANGQYGYLATGESVNGKRVNYWGTFGKW